MKSQLKRFIKECFLKLPFIKRKKDKYIKSVRESYDYSSPAPSILCSTCIGGMIYHNLGLRFNSPTVNLWMTPSDLVKLVLRLDYYRECPMSFVKTGGYDFPVADIDDIRVYFQHYTDEVQAETKWRERFLRIDKDNIYVITDENGLSEDEAEALLKSSFRRVVIFTGDKTKKEPYFCYKCYEGKESVGYYSVRGLDGFAPFEREFDYAKWLSNR